MRLRGYFGAGAAHRLCRMGRIAMQPGWLTPYHLTGLLMQIEIAELRFDRAALPGALSDKSMPCTVPPADFILNFKEYQEA